MKNNTVSCEDFSKTHTFLRNLKESYTTIKQDSIQLKKDCKSLTIVQLEKLSHFNQVKTLIKA